MTTDGTDQRTDMTTARSDAEIRVEVRREVTGLTYEQLGDLISTGEDGTEPAGPAERHRAAVRMAELKRIRNLVSYQVFDGYTPAGDPEERGQGHPASGGVRPPEQRGIYQVLARCTEPEHPGASEVTNRATADSVEEAAVKVRRAKEGNLYGPPGLYRIVEVFEDTPSNSARHMLDALSQTAAEIGSAAAAAADAYEPGPDASDLFEVLADFFHRTVVHPWHLAYPGDRGDGSTPQQPRGSDHGRALARLLLAHLEALGTPLATTAASSAMLVAHLQQPASPAPQEAPVEDSGPAPALDAVDVLAAAERFPWAVAAPGERHWPDGSDFLDVALSAVRPEEREGYIERLEAFVEQHRARLEEMLRTHGPGSKPASHGRYALIGQPETLVILERMESAPFLLRGQWEKELEMVFLDDLEFVWGPRIRLSR
ncbi:hypothetical protein [Streptomyces acidiscabies]|uniref:hypothetical protein n=1 Tax=Streptomyces acidiscabies TaxID=42234 RepID=UPI0009534BD4|nr:hypothetical protein [Streptomyces acidiscabies]